MLENKISIVISDLTKGEVITHIREAQALLPGLLSLTPGERLEMLKLGDKSFGFNDHTYAHAEVDSQFMPNYATMAEYKKDVDARKQLYSIRAVVQGFLNNIDDSLMIVGSEEFYVSLAYYNSVKLAAKSNVPGAKAIYDDLKGRFPGRAGNPIVPPIPAP